MSYEQRETEYYEYVTLHLDPTSSFFIFRGDFTKDCEDWLLTNVGQGAREPVLFYLGLPEREHEWGLGPMAIREEKRVRLMFFREERQAMMFKLAWGGL